MLCTGIPPHTIILQRFKENMEKVEAIPHIVQEQIESVFKTRDDAAGTVSQEYINSTYVHEVNVFI